MPLPAEAATGNGRAAALVIASGVCAALHVAKLPPAIPALQAALGISLVQAGFLLSAVQMAGMLAGVAFGAAADGIGHRRSLLVGLVLLAGASAAGAASTGAAAMLLLRVAEGCGFLLVVLAAPPLLRTVVPLVLLPRAIGFWGAYMPAGTALAFLGGPLVIAGFGWRAWWSLLALLTLIMAAWAWRGLPTGDVSRAASADDWFQRLRTTLRDAGPWSVALAFGAYSAQWLALIGFLPTLYAAAGWPAGVVALASAGVAGVNAIGNIAAGQLLHRGVRPGTLLRTGLVMMALGALAAFAEPGGSPLPAPLRVLSVGLFSIFGGMVPATLFTLAVRLAPRPEKAPRPALPAAPQGGISKGAEPQVPMSVGTTIGWVQQLSAMGQFAGPPLVAWVASWAGGFRHTGVVTALLAGVGLLLVQWLLHIERGRAARKGTAL